MKRITLPPSIVPSGRPKGSGKTAINLKRKPAEKNSSDSAPLQKKRKFFDMDPIEQGPVIVQWLTNWPLDKIRTKKVTYGDIIQDAAVFNRLKNKKLDLNDIKKFLEKKTFNYISNEVDRIQKIQLTCVKCKKWLNGLQIMCVGCIDWYHGKCIGVKNASAGEGYFCTSCKCG